VDDFIWRSVGLALNVAPGISAYLHVVDPGLFDYSRSVAPVLEGEHAEIAGKIELHVHGQLV
jgi:hypothetical protein